MWLFFALLAPTLFALVHVMDSYCVDDLFDEPWIGTVTSSIATLIVTTAPLPFVLPFVEVSLPSLPIFLLCFGAGALIQISQFFYFKSLGNTEAGIVAAYWNLIPVFVPILSFLIFRDILSSKEYAGIGILILCSTYLLTYDANKIMRKQSLLLMVAACLMQSFAYLMLDSAYAYVPFFEAFVIMSLGLVLAGFLPFFFRKKRLLLKKNYVSLVSARKLFIFIEVVNVFALAFAQKAIELGNPSLVAAIETTIPAFVFIYILAATRMKWFSGIKRVQNIYPKMAIILSMAFGVFLIS